MTLAPTMAAAEESLTVPTMTALLDCAMAQEAMKTVAKPTMQSVRKLFNRLIRSSPAQ